MFNKLITATAILALSTGVAFASQYHAKSHHKPRCVQYDRYVEPSCPSPCVTCAPSTCCAIPLAPYVGFSIGARDNFSGTPVNFIGLDQGNVSLGYGGVVVGKFYLAAELFGLGTISIKDYTNLGNGAKTTWGIGASILPGFTITNNLLLYARVGGVYNRFSDQSVNKAGWQGGIGTEMDICTNWGIRSEFAYTWFGNVSGIDKAQAYVYNLGFIYRFI